jgi:iron complex transport system substrate-binding protein
VAARAQKLIALVAIALIVSLTGSSTAQNRTTDSAPRRIVSLVPAITEMLFATGAGPHVVAVSSFDEFPAEVKSLPKVGALLDPDTERILTLRPDLVVVYGSQSDLQTQLERAGIRTFSYRHGGLTTTLDTIRDVGIATGHRREAEALVSALRARLDAVRERVKGRPRPRTVLVFERQPGALRGIYVSSGAEFLNDMLEVAGGTNVFADIGRESVQPSIETLLARAPEVILEVRAVGLIDKNQPADRDPWSVLSSVPAVRSGRINRMTGAYLVVPGPRLGMAVEAFARALHPDVFK